MAKKTEEQQTQIMIGTQYQMEAGRYRLLSYSEYDDCFVFVKTDAKHQFIRIRRTKFLEDFALDKIKPVAENKAWSVDLSKEEKEKMMAWQREIEKFIAASPSYEELFTRGSKNDLKKEAAQAMGVSVRYFNILLERYILSGKNMYSLIDRRKTNGAERKIQNDIRKSLGLEELPDAENVDETKDAAFRFALDYMHKGHRIRDSYDKMISTYYSIPTVKNGVVGSDELPHDRIPSYSAFWRYVNKHQKEDSIKDAEKGPYDYENNHRPLSGNQQSGLTSIGQQFQIDEWEVPVMIVDEADRTHVLGKPVAYMVMDSFSEIITGAYVGLKNNSYAGFTSVIISMLQPHAEELAEYGLSCTDDEFPSMVLPKEFITDCGAEYRSKNCEAVLAKQGIDIKHATPGCGSKKGGIENAFKRVKDLIEGPLTGHGFRKKNKHNATETAQKEAHLTLNEMRRIIYIAILFVNKNDMPGYTPDAEMIEAGIQLSPSEIWKFCRENRYDPHNITAENALQVKFDLLLNDRNLEIDHRKGIHYKDLYFFADEDWFIRMIKEKKPDAEIRYDPSFIDYVYVRYKMEIHKVPLAPEREQALTYKGMPWDEYDRVYGKVKDMHNTKEKDKARRKAKNEIEETAELSKSLQGEAQNDTKGIRDSREEEKLAIDAGRNEAEYRQYAAIPGGEADAGKVLPEPSDAEISTNDDEEIQEFSDEDLFGRFGGDN